MKLPPNVAPADFAAATREMAGIVGAQWVFTSAEDVDLYKDSYTPFVGEPERQYEASAAVAPASVEEVQQLVRVANKYRLPLYAISTGRNIGYGGSAPTYSGSVIVDLKRMNRIVEHSEREAYVVVEPGVSFYELYEFLQSRNSQLMASPPEPGWGSPIGNALDHGVGGVAGDNFGQVHGVEVVLGTGELLRTGMGALKDPRLWQNYRYGFGPYLDGIFSQSNFGIVTKMGFWLVPRPEMQQGFTAVSFRSEDLHEMVDAAQMMRYQGLLHSTVAACPVRALNGGADGSVSSRNPDVAALLRAPGGGSHAQWDELAVRLKVPAAVMVGSARGPAVVVEATLKHAEAVFRKIPGVNFIAQPPVRFPIDTKTFDDEQKSFYGIPSLWAFSRMAIQGSSLGHFYFSPVAKATAQDLFAVNETVIRVLQEEPELLDRFGWRGGLGSYPKAYVLLYEFMISSDPKVNARRREIFTKLVDTCGARGWAEYRTPPAFQDLVMGQYSANNNALRRFCETIKDAVDPNGILAPGKSGIWPKNLRRA
jgi:(+)-pinoresinol hydroxylase